MKKIVAGCMAALMLCSGALAEARTPGELHAQIEAAKTGAAPIQQAQNSIAPEAGITFTDIPETEDSIMVPEAVAIDAGVSADNPETAAPQAEDFMAIESAANETTAESGQGRKPGDLMGSIHAGNGVSFAQQDPVSIGVIGGADGPTEIIVTSAAETQAPAEDDLPETAAAETSGRKPGDLMGSIHAGSGVSFVQQEQTATEAIGGQDGPTVSMTATAEEPAASEEPAETDVVGCPTEEPVATEIPPAMDAAEPTTQEIFVLRDSITWASTKDEVIASFDADVSVEEGIDDDMTVKTEYVNAWTVPVSSFEGRMYCWFHEDQLFAMVYWIDLEDADLKRLIAALDSKYGANVPGGEAYESITSLMTEDFYDDYDDYMSGDFYNWTGPQNTQIVLMDEEGECGLFYFNGNYIPTLREAVASRTASLFGI